MTQLSSDAQAVMDLADFIITEDFQTVLSSLQTFENNMADCPSRHHLTCALTCLNNLAARAPDDVVAFTPAPEEPEQPEGDPE